ncbi:MAG: putative transporter [Bacteroidaceae bacterium]|nr:putative transporter [Bacteroidaceae bacterium]
MQWLIDLLMTGGGVAHTVVLYSIVIALGVALGSKVKIAGISLGVTWILFVGILAGDLLMRGGVEENTAVLNFVQDFGLILFVFSIGLQVGPSFFSSLKQGGLKANGVAAGIVALNIVVMLTLYYSCRNFIPAADNLPMMVGTLCGAITNTPGLGAANAALDQINAVSPNIFGEDGIPVIANGYACAYPLGVVGIILSIVLIRVFFKVNFKAEEDHFNKKNGKNEAVKPHLMTIKVFNPAINGKTILQVRGFIGRDFVCSRLLHNGHITVPNKDTLLTVDDKLYIVCAHDDAEAIIAFIGPETEVDWEIQDVTMASKKLTVTKSSINGKTLGSLHSSSIYGVNVTRIYRSGIELFASPSVILQVGDIITTVGPEDSVDRFANKIGDSKQALDKPNLLTLFVGILVGIIFGMIPISIPGMSVPVKLGLAGGPLIIAICLGRFGYKLKLVAYTTNSASLMIRDIGLVLFLASVGIKAGGNFVDTVINGGYHYVWMGFLITVIPLIAMGIFARAKWRMNYFLISGIMAGATTDPPALAFSTAQANNGIPSVGYSTVYPLSMFLRIITAQVLILFFCG